MKFFLLTSLTTASAILSARGNGNGNNGNPNGQIKGKTYSGSGCPTNSIGLTLSQDSSAMTVIFDNFIATSGQNVKTREARKQCTINIDLDFENGWTYAISDVTYRGYVNVPLSLNAVVSSRYDFGTSQKQEYQKVFNDYDDSYLFSISVPDSEQEWSKCKKNGNPKQNGRIRTTLELKGDLKQDGIITVDSLDRKVVQVYAIDWKKC
jgi:hypothetical protein